MTETLKRLIHMGEIRLTTTQVDIERMAKPIGPAIGRSGATPLEELFRIYAPEALRLAYLVTSDRNLAEDITQEAFVRLVARFQTIRRHEAIRSYLRRTVVNLSRDHFRRLRHERLFISRQDPQSRSHRAESEVVDIQMDLLAMLQKLPTRQRTAVVLRHCLGLSVSEVAQTLNTSLPGARTLISRGLGNLRKVMGGQDD